MSVDVGQAIAISRLGLLLGQAEDALAQKAEEVEILRAQLKQFTDAAQQAEAKRAADEVREQEETQQARADQSKRAADAVKGEEAES